MECKSFDECNAYKYSIRKQALDDADILTNELHKKIPQIKEIDAEIISTSGKILEAANRAKDNDLDEKIAAIKYQTTRLIQKRKKILAEHGYEEDYDEPKFQCKLCNDSGYVGHERCECMKALYAEALYRNSGLGDALRSCTFDNFTTTLYMGDVKDGMHPRDVMESTYIKAKSYANHFDKNSGNLFLVGGTGLGKTHLSAAIAEVVIKKGYSVVYETAQKLVNDIRKQQFGEMEIDADKYRNCDLLIIDDLGTEAKTEYNLAIINDIINDRIVNKKSMIISTNLDSKKINEIYSPRICSRLLGEFSPLMFVGKDIRLIKKTL